MSRRHSDDPAFNSDSFLDIVCNLVGIMIILIIVAGLRVSRAPVDRHDDEPAPPAPQPVIAARPELPPPPTGMRTTEIAEWLESAPAAPAVPVAKPPEPPPVEQPPTDLIDRAEELRRQLAQHKDRQAELQARVAAARQQRSSAAEEVRSLSDRLSADRAESEAKAAEAAAATRDLQQLESQAAQLATQVDTLAQRPPDVKVLTHSVTPISRQVSNRDELHIRIAGNRVSVVPLESLAEALKLRMQRSRDLFLRVNRYEGTAGPVDGFLMRYVVEKQVPSAIEELRAGGQFFRIQLAYYELEMTSDAFTETLDQALRPGSRFLNALGRARPGTSLTFWVYPDSFEAHRALQEYAHEAGFDVAARPLPLGVPIAGSPHGTRSAAQ